MRLYFEALDNVITALGTGVALKVQEVVKSKDDAVALKVLYPGHAVYRLHIHRHDENLPCEVIDI